MSTIKSRTSTIFGFMKEVFSGFGDDKVMKFSASLSYYTVFSIAPLLVLIISIFGIFLGREAVRGQIYKQIDDLVGSDAAKQIQDMIGNSHRSGNSFIATVISSIVVGIRPTTIFGEIQ